MTLPLLLKLNRAGPEKAIVKGTAPIKEDGAVALKLNNGGKEYEIFGFAKEVPTSNVANVSGAQTFFVTPRGGEYFFIPSISTIEAWATAA
jgi:hypothetical protein